MSLSVPENLDEWRQHIAALTAEEVAAKAPMANTARFVLQLQGDGFSARDIHAILVMLAKRVEESGVQFPPGLYDFALLSREARPW